jgi:hypothetical protein
VLLVVLLGGQPAANERNAKGGEVFAGDERCAAVPTSVDSSGQPSTVKLKNRFALVSGRPVEIPTCSESGRSSAR